MNEHCAGDRAFVPRSITSSANVLAMQASSKAARRDLRAKSSRRSTSTPTASAAISGAIQREHFFADLDYGRRVVRDARVPRRQRRRGVVHFFPSAAAEAALVMATTTTTAPRAPCLRRRHTTASGESRLHGITCILRPLTDCRAATETNCLQGRRRRGLFWLWNSGRTFCDRNDGVADGRLHRYVAHRPVAGHGLARTRRVNPLACTTSTAAFAPSASLPQIIRVGQRAADQAWPALRSTRERDQASHEASARDQQADAAAATAPRSRS